LGWRNKNEKGMKPGDNLKAYKTIEQQKRRKLLAMQGKVIWEGPLDEMRGA
jgi:hypothetical protein